MSTRLPSSTPATVKLDSPAKRLRIAPRRNPYWQACGAARGGLSLGYRKPSRGAGAWIARLIQEGRRIENRLGGADDPGGPAPHLTFAQAVAAAMEWAASPAVASGPARESPALTIRTALADYVAERKKKDARHGRNAETRLGKWVLADDRLADKPLADLVENDLTTWAKAVAASSPASVVRLLNDLKAALNRSHDLHHRQLPAGWREVVSRGLRRPAVAARPKVTHRRLVIEDDEVRSLVAAALAHDDGGDFGQLVAVLAATGARFSQIARLMVADVVTGAAPRIMVPGSMKGRDPSRKASHTPVPVGADVIKILKPAIDGRRGDEPLLMRWFMRVVAGDKATGTKKHWERDRRVPWANAYEMTPHWRETVARAGLDGELQPYRLRDASIIRGLRAGQPVRLVAAQHDTSVEMIEKHYAQHISDALADLTRKGVIALV